MEGAAALQPIKRHSLPIFKTEVSGPSIVIVSPIASDGIICLTQGDDYKAADSRAIVVTLAGFPSVVGASVVLEAESTFDATIVNIVGSITNSTTIQFEITHAVTAALTIGSAAYRYQMIATLADGSVVTLQARIH